MTGCNVSGDSVESDKLLIEKLQGIETGDKVLSNTSWAYGYADLRELASACDIAALISVSSLEEYTLSGLLKTKYSAIVKKSFWGSIEGDEIKILMTGGSSDSQTVLSIDDPPMQVGDEFIIFTRKKNDGTYTILSGPQGRFTLDDGYVSSLEITGSRKIVDGMKFEDFVSEVMS